MANIWVQRSWPAPVGGRCPRQWPGRLSRLQRLGRTQHVQLNTLSLHPEGGWTNTVSCWGSWVLEAGLEELIRVPGGEGGTGGLQAGEAPLRGNLRREGLERRRCALGAVQPLALTQTYGKTCIPSSLSAGMLPAPSRSPPIHPHNAWQGDAILTSQTRKRLLEKW